MPPLRQKEVFQQCTEIERGRIIELRERGLFYRPIAARVQRNSSTVMRVWKRWTDKHQTTEKTSNEQQKVSSVRDDRHLFCMTVNYRTASSRQLESRWSNATGELKSASLIRRRLPHSGLGARVSL